VVAGRQRRCPRCRSRLPRGAASPGRNPVGGPGGPGGPGVAPEGACPVCAWLGQALTVLRELGLLNGVKFGVPVNREPFARFEAAVVAAVQELNGYTPEAIPPLRDVRAVLDAALGRPRAAPRGRGRSRDHSLKTLLAQLPDAFRKAAPAGRRAPGRDALGDRLTPQISGNTLKATYDREGIDEDALRAAFLLARPQSVDAGACAVRTYLVELRRRREETGTLEPGVSRRA
jgi:hypothetical protein